MQEETEELPFYVDRAKTGRAACKKCKQKIDVGVLRMAKLAYNPFASGMVKNWHHVGCMFEVFAKMRKTTRKIESYADIGGWDDLSKEDKETIKGHFSPEDLKTFDEKKTVVVVPVVSKSEDNKDMLFRTFRKICNDLTQESGVKAKVDVVRDFFEKGSSGSGFQGDLYLWCKSLLPMATKRIYNLQSDQLVKIFSGILGQDESEMRKDLEQGDVAETISKFMEGSKITPAKKSQLTLQDVEKFLERLSKLTREVDQINHFHTILPDCTSNDLKMIIRLIKHDLRTNAGPNRILLALDENAVAAFQASRDLEVVVKNAIKNKAKGKTGMTVGITLMTPVLPMLAEACTSVEKAFKRCPGGMFSEIKYDGERVQLHKQGNNFKYFSRSLKPVVPHKVKDLEEYIPRAFPHGKDLILDSEILLVDTTTGALLPFGTLGTHKRTQFQNACVCLFVFDCIYFNGTSLVGKPLTERRDILKENMTEIPNRVQFSEMKHISKTSELEDMIERVLRQGLEGLVLKALNSVYEPGKRRWLKVKKDYLAGGSMADSADLVVLGAWYGTGKKGGIMSVFLMGCLCKKRNVWVTVTKVYGGLDDKKLNSLQNELIMSKAGKDSSNVPSWLLCDKTMVPDFLIRDPKNSQVWEICGAEFSCNQAVHTADGISIRFPRVKRIRTDKNWETATTLEELKRLYKASKDTSGFTLKRHGDSSASEESPQKGEKRPSDSLDKKTAEKKQKTDSSHKRPSSSSDLEKTPKKVKSESSEKRQRDSSISNQSTKKMTVPDKVNSQNSASSVAKKNHENCNENLDNNQIPILMKNPLPDLFDGKVIYLTENVPESVKLERFIIAYGGKIYKEQFDTALRNANYQVTHVIYPFKKAKNKINVKKSHCAVHVSVDWLWESIKSLKCQREGEFKIKFD